MFTNVNWNLVIASITSSIIFGLIFISAFIYNNGEEKSLFFLSAVFGVSIGWALGVAATPFDIYEKRRLSEITKIAYGFLTGYLISKIDAILSHLISKDLFAQKDLWIFAMIIITSLLTTLTITYTNRSYWLNDIRKQRQKSSIEKQNSSDQLGEKDNTT